MNERIRELEYENHLLKTTYSKCRDCKNADLYIPTFTYPYFNPKCRITGESLEPNQDGCIYFKFAGRCSR